MDTNEELISSIYNISRLVKRETFLKKCFVDLSHSEVEVLLFLRESKVSTMKSIADHLRIKPSSATPVVDRLFGKKILKRIADKKDRRIVYISLTKNGLKEMEAKWKQMHKDIKKVFNKINKKDKKDLIKVLKRILKNYEQAE